MIEEWQWMCWWEETGLNKDTIVPPEGPWKQRSGSQPILFAPFGLAAVISRCPCLWRTAGRASFLRACCPDVTASRMCFWKRHRKWVYVFTAPLSSCLDGVRESAFIITKELLLVVWLMGDIPWFMFALGRLKLLFFFLSSNQLFHAVTQCP